MAMLIPYALELYGKEVRFKDLSETQLVAFAQEEALTAMMKGTPFGTIIRDAVLLGATQERAKAKK